MRVVNNRYEVIRSLSDGESSEKYLVKDRFMGGMEKVLEFFDADDVSKNFLDYFESNFVELKNHRHPNLVNLYEYGPVGLEDNIASGVNEYFYTYEYVEYTPVNYLELDKTQVTEAISQLCKVLRFLHFRGVVYKHLNFDNIKFYVHVDNSVTVKLANLAKIGTMDFSDYVAYDEGAGFIAPELTWGEGVGYTADIYSFGVIFYYLYNRRPYILGEAMTLPPNHALTPFISRCMSQIAEDRFQNIDELIDELKNLIWLEVPRDDYRYYDRIQDRTKLVGHENILRELMKIIENEVQKNTKYNKVFVLGPDGTGKTRLMREVLKLCLFRNINAVNISIREDSEPYHCIEAVLNHIYRAGMNITNVLVNYGVELGAIASEYSGMVGETGEQLDRDRDHLRIINRAVKFVRECCVDKALIILADGAEHMHEYDRLFFEQLLTEEHSIGALGVFSMPETVVGVRSNVGREDMLRALNSDLNLMELQPRGDSVQQLEENDLGGFARLGPTVRVFDLPNLDLEQIGEMIKISLGMNKKPYDLVHPMLFESSGKPPQIRNLLMAYYNSGVIRFDREKYEWVFSTNEDDYSIRNYSEYLDVQTELLSNLPEDKVETLSRLAVVDGGFSIRGTLQMLGAAVKPRSGKMKTDNSAGSDAAPAPGTVMAPGYDISLYSDRDLELVDFMMKLIDKNIVIEKSSDYGYVYSIREGELKNTLYHHLSEEEKRQYSAQAAEIAREESEFFGVVDEKTAFYYKVAGMHAEAGDYAIKIADQFEDVKSYGEYVDMLKFAIEEYKLVGDHDKAEVASGRLADRLFVLGQTEDMVEVLENCNIDNRECLIKSHTLQARVKLFRSELDDALIEIEKGIELTKGVDDREYLRFVALLLNYYLAKNDNGNAMAVIQAAEEFALSKGYDDYYNYFLHRDYSVVSEGLPEEKVLEAYEKTRKYFNMASEAILYCDVMNIEAQRRYFDNRDLNGAIEVLEESHRAAANFNYVLYTARFNQTAGYIYWHASEYEKAAGYLEEAVKLSEKYGTLNVELNALTKLAASKLEICEYSQAYIQLSKLDYITKESDVDARDNHDLYKIEYMLAINNLLTARQYRYALSADYLRSAADIFRLKIIDIRMDYLSDLFGGRTTLSGSVMKNLQTLQNDLTGYISAKYYRELILEIIISQLMLNDISTVTKLRQLSEETEHLYNSEKLQLQASVADAFLSGNPVEALESLAIQSSKISAEQTWRIYYILGNLEFSSRHYIQALKAYLKAFERIKDLAGRVPQTQQKQYIINDQFKMRLRAKIDECIDTIKESNGIKTERSTRTIININDFFDIHEFNRMMHHDHIAGKVTGNEVARTTAELTKLFGEDEWQNMQLMLEFLGSIIFAKRGFIFIMGDPSPRPNIITMRPEDGRYDNSKLLQVLGNESSTVASKLLPNTRTGVLKGEQRALMHVPIPELESSFGRRRRGYTQSSGKKIIAHLYFDTDDIVNRFDPIFLDFIESYSSLIAVFIESASLKKSSEIDKLTGVYLRKHYDQRFAVMLDDARLEKEQLAVIMLDIDHFKGVNDNYGHKRGDQVLSSIGRILIDTVRSTDLVARYGGEEFVVVLPQTDADDAFMVAEKIRTKVEESKLMGDERELTVSLGVSVFPENGHGTGELVENADRALYYSKGNGRNRTTLYDIKTLEQVKDYKGTDSILSGRIDEDNRRVQCIVKIIEAIGTGVTGRIEVFKQLLEIVSAQSVEFYKLDEEGSIITAIKVTPTSSEIEKDFEYDYVNLRRFAMTGSGESFVDWDQPIEGSIADWNSVIVTSFSAPGRRGVLMIKVPISMKEFDLNDFNIIASIDKLVGKIIFEEF